MKFETWELLQRWGCPRDIHVVVSDVVAALQRADLAVGGLRAQLARTHAELSAHMGNMEALRPFVSAAWTIGGGGLEQDRVFLNRTGPNGAYIEVWADQDSCGWSLERMGEDGEYQSAKAGSWPATGVLEAIRLADEWCDKMESGEDPDA